MKKLECINILEEKNRPLTAPSFRKCSERKNNSKSYLFCNDFNKESIQPFVYLFIYLLYFFFFNFWPHPWPSWLSQYQILILTIIIVEIDIFINLCMIKWYESQDLILTIQEFGKFLYFILKFYLPVLWSISSSSFYYSFIKIIVKASN